MELKHGKYYWLTRVNDPEPLIGRAISQNGEYWFFFCGNECEDEAENYSVICEVEPPKRKKPQTLAAA